MVRQRGQYFPSREFTVPNVLMQTVYPKGGRKKQVRERKGPRTLSAFAAFSAAVR